MLRIGLHPIQYVQIGTARLDAGLLDHTLPVGIGHGIHAGKHVTGLHLTLAAGERRIGNAVQPVFTVARVTDMGRDDLKPVLPDDLAPGELLNHQQIARPERVIEDTLLCVQINGFCRRIDMIHAHHIRGQAGTVLTGQLGDDQLVYPHHPADGDLVQLQGSLLLRHAGGVQHVLPE